MKRIGWMLAAVFFAACGSAHGQDRIEADKAKKYAGLLTELTAKLDDRPFKVAADPEKAVGIHADQRGCLVVPDANLSEAVLKNADKEIVPVGLVFLYRLTPMVGEQPIAADKHRTLEVDIEDNKATINVLHLGVSRVAGRLVLLVFTKGKEATIVRELTEGAENRPDIFDVEARFLGNNGAAFLFTVANRHRAAFSMVGND